MSKATARTFTEIRDQIQRLQDQHLRLEASEYRKLDKLARDVGVEIDAMSDEELRQLFVSFRDRGHRKSSAAKGAVVAGTGSADEGQGSAGHGA